MNDIQNLYTEENEFKKKTNEFFGILIGGCISEKVYITVKMYPCSGGTDTVSPGL